MSLSWLSRCTSTPKHAPSVRSTCVFQEGLRKRNCIGPFYFYNLARGIYYGLKKNFLKYMYTYMHIYI